VLICYPYARAMARSRTSDDVLRETRPRHGPALARAAREAGIAYPPPALTLVGLKRERRLEVFAPKGEGWTRLRSYPVLAASGGPGPKLREGDLQVPEGIYRLTHLNPNSSYHLSVRIDYPNAFDRARGREDGRAQLGGDIYLHGKAASIGCLALGDEGIEELFTLLADVGLARARMLLAPGASLAVPAGAPPWLGGLYAELRAELAKLGLAAD
jgi:murein L,D-transpeptidase YafK